MNTSEAKRKKIENLISKFHHIVSHGPLYVCSCCAQLVLLLKDIYIKEKVSTTKNGCVKHATVIW